MPNAPGGRTNALLTPRPPKYLHRASQRHQTGSPSKAAANRGYTILQLQTKRIDQPSIPNKFSMPENAVNGRFKAPKEQYRNNGSGSCKTNITAVSRMANLDRNKSILVEISLTDKSMAVLNPSFQLEDFIEGGGGKSKFPQASPEAGPSKKQDETEKEEDKEGGGGDHHGLDLKLSL
ncbi:hypothetical protein RHSIM_Rhsim05G0130400 [Rhododendron simsii]|uniref:Uncharacterized protein n=1 Tax=Rhododendron simsii TaxID=118357 RepID=A0A834LMH7_RHOSS|nr:hypothetical protein RHSIM_Rhsim05G0130400 [Rhododendron simsii]